MKINREIDLIITAAVDLVNISVMYDGIQLVKMSGRDEPLEYGVNWASQGVRLANYADDYADMIKVAARICDLINSFGFEIDKSIKSRLNDTQKNNYVGRIYDCLLLDNRKLIINLLKGYKEK